MGRMGAVLVMNRWARYSYIPPLLADVQPDPG